MLFSPIYWNNMFPVYKSLGIGRAVSSVGWFGQFGNNLLTGLTSARMADAVAASLSLSCTVSPAARSPLTYPLPSAQSLQSVVSSQFATNQFGTQRLSRPLLLPMSRATLLSLSTSSSSTVVFASVGATDEPGGMRAIFRAPMGSG